MMATFRLSWLATGADLSIESISPVYGILASGGIAQPDGMALLDGTALPDGRAILAVKMRTLTWATAASSSVWPAPVLAHA